MPTSDERIARWEQRQEVIIASMNRMVDTMEVIRDMIGELAAWLKQPASNDLPDLLKALIVRSEILERTGCPDRRQDRRPSGGDRAGRAHWRGRVIGFAQIIGGKPSSVSGMTDHLMNKTLALGPEDERLALYYGRGQVRDPLQELARAVADSSLTFSEAVETAMSERLRAGGSLDPRCGRRETRQEDRRSGHADSAGTGERAGRGHSTGSASPRRFWPRDRRGGHPHQRTDQCPACRPARRWRADRGQALRQGPKPAGEPEDRRTQPQLSDRLI